MSYWAVAAITLLEFTGPTGGRLDVNIDAISSIREPANMPEGHFAKGTHCVLILMNGHMVAVQEECDAVRKIVNGGGPCVKVCGEAPRR